MYIYIFIYIYICVFIYSSRCVLVPRVSLILVRVVSLNLVPGGSLNSRLKSVLGPVSRVFKCFFFITLGTGPRRPVSLVLSDTTGTRCSLPRSTPSLDLLQRLDNIPLSPSCTPFLVPSVTRHACSECCRVLSAAVLALCSAGTGGLDWSLEMGPGFGNSLWMVLHTHFMHPPPPVPSLRPLFTPLPARAAPSNPLSLWIRHRMYTNSS